MIEVYLDESGTHHSSPVVVVAAVWADKEEWAVWSERWNDAKAPIQIYHSADCHNRSGEFAGWDHSRRDEYVKKILSVIRDRSIYGHFAVIEKKKVLQALIDRHKLTIADKDATEGYYSVCFNWAIRAAAEFLIKRNETQFKFIAEKNDYEDISRRMFNRLINTGVLRYSSLSFAGKDDFAPLQCADIIAYEGNKQMRNGTSLDRRRPLQAIDPTGDRFGFVMPPPEALVQMADSLAAFLKSK